MRMHGMLKAGAFGAGLLAISGAVAHAAASSFDGAWQAVVACPDDGTVKGYNWAFPVRVHAGALLGRYVNPRNNSNYGVLTGNINANGDALLKMAGVAGDAAYNVAHIARGSPIKYSASVHFAGTSGSGARNGQRPCSLHFTRK